MRHNAKQPLLITHHFKAGFHHASLGRGFLCWKLSYKVTRSDWLQSDPLFCLCVCVSKVLMRGKPGDPAHNKWLLTANMGDIRHAPLPLQSRAG